VVGPLYGNETSSMVSLLKNHNITMLSLSNDTSINSDFLLIMGISPDSQANAITNYAIGKGIEHFHLILPKNKFGQLIDNTVENIVLDKNNITHSINWYNQENAENVINELVSGIDNNKTQSIFMPQAGENLKFLNQALAKYKLNNVTILGLQSWDNPNLLELKSLNNAIFLRKNIAESGFYDNYSRTFNLAATNIDFITYNSIMMLINMHRDQLTLDKKDIIENNKNYGKYSDVIFDQNGISLYKLSIAKIENREFKTLENIP
jgi:ABC-type branched-subunit amino acid transport system substrate-binding protein